MWKDLYVAGDIGSEGGTILADEEYKNSCRITLEKCEKYYAITCGIYGSMVHTAFSDFEHYQKLYDTMTGIQYGKIEDKFNWVYKLKN